VKELVRQVKSLHTHTCASARTDTHTHKHTQGYDRKRFTDGGFNHYDLYFPDGSCPREAILLHFLELAEAEPGALAVRACFLCACVSLFLCVQCVRALALAMSSSCTFWSWQRPSTLAVRACVSVHALALAKPSCCTS